MNAKGIYSSHAFAGNPIILEDKRRAVGSQLATLEVFLGGESVFAGRYSPPGTVNLSEIVSSIVPKLPEADPQRLYPVECIETVAGLRYRRLEVTMTFAGEQEDFDCTMLPGGISNQNFSVLASRGTDIFAERFFNYTGNFFLTTRTNSWHIMIPETELMPLYFFLNRKAVVRIKSTTGGKIYDAGELDAMASYVLNPAAVRRYFFTQHNALLSQFDVYVDDVRACRISILHDKPAKERCYLKFRNSLGVFEMISIAEPLVQKLAEGSEEPEIFSRYNPTTDSFSDHRPRQPYGLAFTTSTGPCSPERLRFMLDMVRSEEVYLITPGQLPIRVIPSAEEISWDVVPKAPQRFDLTLTPVNETLYCSDPIVDGSESEPGRIFTDHYSSHFI